MTCKVYLRLFPPWGRVHHILPVSLHLKPHFSFILFCDEQDFCNEEEMDKEKIRIFINGLGRIGRSAARIILEDDTLDLVGFNDLYSYDQMAYLLKYEQVTRYNRWTPAGPPHSDVFHALTSRLSRFTLTFPFWERQRNPIRERNLNGGNPAWQ